MEKPPDQHIIVGKDLNKKITESGEQLINRRIEKGQSLVKGEVERKEHLNEMIRTAKFVISRELDRLGIEPTQEPSEDSFHFYDPHAEGSPHNKNHFRPFDQSVHVENIHDKNKVDRVKDRISNFLGKEGTYSRRYQGFEKLLHETIHAYSHLEYKAGFVEDNRFLRAHQTGYHIIDMFGKTTTSKLRMFNEGVVQRLTKELLDKEDAEITKQLNFSNTEKERRGRAQGAYGSNVELIQVLTKDIAEYKGVPEEAVWNDFKKGHFTGEMMHLRVIDEVYGEGSLHLLGVADEITKKESKRVGRVAGDTVISTILRYFQTKDTKYKDELLQKDSK